MAKIAISLTDQVMDAVEKARHDRGESRSQFFRRAVEEYLRRDREQAAIAAYIAGYQKFPETKRERALSESMAGYAFDQDSSDQDYWEAEFRK